MVIALWTAWPVIFRFRQPPTKITGQDGRFPLFEDVLSDTLWYFQGFHSLVHSLPELLSPPFRFCQHQIRHEFAELAQHDFVPVIVVPLDDLLLVGGVVRHVGFGSG